MSCWHYSAYQLLLATNRSYRFNVQGTCLAGLQVVTPARLRTTSVVLGQAAALMILSASKENNAVIFKDLEVGEESKGREHVD
jgi:hypothetical protein